MNVMQAVKRGVGAIRGACRSYFLILFDLTPDERRVVMLITMLFILGLVVRLLRG